MAHSSLTLRVVAQSSPSRKTWRTAAVFRKTWRTAAVFPCKPLCRGRVSAQVQTIQTRASSKTSNSALLQRGEPLHRLALTARPPAALAARRCVLERAGLLPAKRHESAARLRARRKSRLAQNRHVENNNKGWSRSGAAGEPRAATRGYQNGLASDSDRECRSKRGAQSAVQPLATRVLHHIDTNERLSRGWLGHTARKAL